MKIRLFQPDEAEYEAIFAVAKAVWPENPTTVAEFKHADATHNPAHFRERMVVEENGRIIAFATCSNVWWSSDPDRYRFSIAVHPDFERQGIGTAVYEHILNRCNAQTPPPRILESGTYQHKTQSVRFLQKHGFHIVMRWIISTLDVPAFDVAQFAALRQRIAGRGIAIRPLPQQIPHDPDWQKHLWELDWALTQDEPLPFTPQQLPLEEFVQRHIEAPNVIHDAWFVALDNGRYVGMTQLERNESDPTRYSTGFTGTVRSHRRIGLATALKTCAIEYAQQQGIQLIRTGNEESNPMYLLNKKLGFTDSTANLAFEKEMSDE